MLCPPPVVAMIFKRARLPGGYLSTSMTISGPGPPGGESKGNNN